MLPSFVIGLREGLEAALIVGIIAAFLRKQGRRDLVRWVLLGVGVAVLLCLAAGIALNAFSQNLPQREQEGLETVIAVLAVGMVTYMVVWMKRHSRDLKGQLETLAASAVTTRNAGRAMVLMAFLAVIREGLETVVFLLAAFNETDNGGLAGLGALLGILVATGLGYGIYRGGVRLNLSKFFRVTGFVLVLVAAGLVVNAFHTAHEAGWVDFGQARTVDLTWLVQPGTVLASLLTGFLGLQPRPVVVELVAWLVYLVPVGVYVLWPQGRPAPVRAGTRGGLAVGIAAGVAAIVCFTIAPAVPAAPSGSTQVQARSAASLTVRTPDRAPGASGDETTLLLGSGREDIRDGLDVQLYATTRDTVGATGRPATLPLERIAALNGGRVPYGIQQTAGRVQVSYTDRLVVTASLDRRTDRVIDVAWRETVGVTARSGTVTAELAKPIADTTRARPAAEVSAAIAAARADHDTLDRRSTSRTAAGWLLGVALVGLLVALAFALLRRRTRTVPEATKPAPDLVRN